MTELIIYVTQIAGIGWRVSGGKGEPRVFRIREHALAFGRALAYSTQSELLVIGPNGSVMRQTRASMTYPLDLN